jgi:hypothetical protein
MELPSSHHTDCDIQGFANSDVNVVSLQCIPVNISIRFRCAGKAFSWPLRSAQSCDAVEDIATFNEEL